MSEITLGIIGGGQLGSMLAISAKKLNIQTVIYCDDPDAPAQNFCNKFISGSYNDKEKIIEFVNLVNYKIYMNKKIKNTENEAQIIRKEDLDHHNSRGIYMRDDHCDWGSSGMNDLIKSLDDNN